MLDQNPYLREQYGEELKFLEKPNSGIFGPTDLSQEVTTEHLAVAVFSDALDSPTSPITSPTSEGMETSEDESEATSASESTPTSSSDDEYLLVGKGKRKKGKSSGSANKAKKPVVARATPPPSEAPQASRPSSQASLSGSPQQPSRPVSPMTVATTAEATPADATPATPLNKSRPPPPLFIHDKAKWTEISKLCDEHKIRFTNARAVQQGIKVTLQSATDYRELNRILRLKNYFFHTYSLQEDKPIRVVIKNVPVEINTAEILSDLESQNIPVAEVHRMHRKGGQSFNMILVVCHPTEGHHPIFKIRTICGLSGLTVERPHRGGAISQCHRCQLYGHAQRFCHGKPRCVKCLGDHGTLECPRPKDRTLCTEPPSCVLCGESGHPANYRGCPKAPKSSAPKLAKRATDRQKRECPTLSGSLPQTLSPQRPSPWNALNHMAHFPAMRSPQKPTSSAIPPLMAKTVSPPAPPRPIVKAAAPSAPRPLAKAQAPRAPVAFTFAAPPPPLARRPFPPQQVLDPFDPFRVITSTFGVFHSPRAKEMTHAIIECKGDFFALAQIFQTYSDVTQALQNLPHYNP